jgi:hypothetical protein
MGFEIIDDDSMESSKGGGALYLSVEDDISFLAYNIKMESFIHIYPYDASLIRQKNIMLILTTHHTYFSGRFSIEQIARRIVLTPKEKTRLSRMKLF